MVEDLHIYKAKFETEPSSKTIKPPVSFADKVFKCDISQDKSSEKKLVTSIVVEQGCFQTELRIAGDSNKLIYFCKITSRIYSTKLLQI